MHMTWIVCNSEELKYIFLQQVMCVFVPVFVSSQNLLGEKTFPTDDAFRSGIYGIFLFVMLAIVTMTVSMTCVSLFSLRNKQCFFNVFIFILFSCPKLTNQPIYPIYSVK